MLTGASSTVTWHRHSQLSPCGICKQEISEEEILTEAQVFWPSDVSGGAHAKCYKEIESFDTELENKISKLFPKNSQHYKRNEAYRKAARTMEEILGKTTLLEFVLANKTQPNLIFELFQKALQSVIVK